MDDELERQRRKQQCIATFWGIIAEIAQEDAQTVAEPHALEAA